MLTSGVFALVLGAAAGHAAWNFAARKVSGSLVVFWLATCVACVAMAPVAVWIWPSSPVFSDPIAILYVGATGSLHTLYFLFLASAYERGEISVVYPVARGAGVGLTALVAWWVLAEPMSFLGTLGISLISCGILAMAWPAYAGHARLHGLGAALGVGCTIPAYSLVDKLGVALVHPILYIWFMYLLSAVLLAPCIAHRYRGSVAATARRYSGHILLIGVGAMLTYLAILYAYQLGPVSYIVAVREFAVVIGAALGIFFLREPLTLVKLLAISCITAGLICIKMS